MPINANYEYYQAEAKYLNAQNITEKILYLEEMIKTAPKHKSSENLLAELKTRLKKLKAKSEVLKKKKSGKKGVKKEGFQFVLLGKSNSGKSSLMAALTNAKPFISEHPFNTKTPEIGTFEYGGVKAQIVDTPSIGSEHFDVGLIHTADCIIEVVSSLDELNELQEMVDKTRGTKFVVVTKSDSLEFSSLRKLVDNMKSKKIEGVIVSNLTKDGIDVLKQLLFNKMHVIRIFTKEPGKKQTEIPIVLNEGANVRAVAEKILKGFSLKVKETRLTGPSGKFVNQKVGLKHKLKDMDVIEFHT
jgi:ribosome-interacting GTPase 1